jgi:hypothetical protein
LVYLCLINVLTTATITIATSVVLRIGLPNRRRQRCILRVDRIEARAHRSFAPRAQRESQLRRRLELHGLQVVARIFGVVRCESVIGWRRMGASGCVKRGRCAAAVEYVRRLGRGRGEEFNAQLLRVVARVA